MAFNYMGTINNILCNLFTNWPTQLISYIQGLNMATASASSGEDKWHFVGSLLDLCHGGRKTVCVDGRRIVLIHAKNHVFAMDSQCYRKLVHTYTLPIYNNIQGLVKTRRFMMIMMMAKIIMMMIIIIG